MDGLSNVSSPNAAERAVASRRGWDEFSRLACQTKVHGDVVVRRLLDNSQDIIVLELEELYGTSAGEGRELDLAILFSDIRDSTNPSERNLPYDIVHMLNRYFTAAAEPVLNNNILIDKYIGDGILAAFGTLDMVPPGPRVRRRPAKNWAYPCRTACRAAGSHSDHSRSGPAVAIVRAVEQDQIDVLGVGNLRMARRKEFLLGNVPNCISQSARCTLIIANTLPRGQRPPQPTRAVIGGAEAAPSEPHLMKQGS